MERGRAPRVPQGASQLGQGQLARHLAHVRAVKVANASGVACPEVLSASQWLHQAPLALFRPRAGHQAGDACAQGSHVGHACPAVPGITNVECRRMPRGSRCQPPEAIGASCADALSCWHVPSAGLRHPAGRRPTDPDALPTGNGSFLQAGHGDAANGAAARGAGRRMCGSRRRFQAGRRGVAGGIRRGQLTPGCLSERRHAVQARRPPRRTRPRPAGSGSIWRVFI
mmetsp:Transcript_42762/g.128356  ORF Transcript_42762/g.128356 Transcript_42762/m.128356 type:complete len:227 (+) Transcript_42762:416-1096(+)